MAIIVHIYKHNDDTHHSNIQCCPATRHNDIPKSSAVMQNFIYNTALTKKKAC